MSESCKQVKKSSTDAENQRISMVNGAVQQMMPLEAAERLKDIKEQMLDNISFDDAHALDYAAYYLRAIAAGEYKQVVHAHITGHGYDLHCSNCGASADIGDDYCKSCGALMNGKDDSHEK
jgi:hypothetical protein